MKVGVVTTSYPSSPADPAGSFVANHVRWLRDSGNDVDVVAAGTGTHPVAPGNLYARGGAPEALEAGAWLSALGFSARMLATVRRASRDWQRAFAHWLVPSGVCAALATRGSPLAVIAHSADVHLLARTRLATPVTALLLRRGAALGFVSEPLRDRLARAVRGTALRAYVEHSSVCPMGIDASKFGSADRSPDGAVELEMRSRVRGARKTVLFVGRLVPVKGAHVLIDAASHLPSDVDVVIAGDGPMRAELERRNRQLGSAARFSGLLAFDRRHELIGTADVVVVPSIEMPGGRTEGLPVVALEAMAAGVPVVASSVGGLVSLPTAARVRPGDPVALAAAIGRTLESPPPVGAARSFALDLDWSRVGPRLDRLFLEQG